MIEYYEEQYKELMNRYLDNEIYNDESLVYFLKQNKFKYTSPTKELSTPYYMESEMSGTGFFDFTKYNVFDMYDLTFIQFVAGYDFATEGFKKFVNDKINIFDDEEYRKQREYRIIFNKILFDRLKYIQSNFQEKINFSTEEEREYAEEEGEEDDLLSDKVNQLDEDFETIKGKEIPDEYLDKDADWYDYGNG